MRSPPDPSSTNASSASDHSVSRLAPGSRRRRRPAVALRRRGEVREPHGRVGLAEQVVDEQRLRRGGERRHLLADDPLVERAARLPRRSISVNSSRARSACRARLGDPARVPVPHLPQHLAHVPARMRVVGDVDDAVGREVRAAGREHRLAQWLARPRVEPVDDHVVELAELPVGEREHVGDVEARVLEPRRLGGRARGVDRAGARSTPTARTSGWAAATPARCAPAPQPSSSTRALRGSAGVSPWSRAIVAWPTAGPA